MLKQKYFLTNFFILSAEKQPIKSSWRKIEWLRFKVYLTGGATWDMMIDNDYSKNKTLLPDFGLGVIQKASYRVVPFSKSKDTREIKRVIIEDQQVKN